MGIVEGDALRFHQTEGIETDTALCGDLIIELSDRSAAEVPGVFVLHISQKPLLGGLFLQLFVDLFKIGISDDRFAPEDQIPRKGKGQGDVLKNSGVGGNDFPDLSVSSGNGLLQGPPAVGQDHGQAVQLPGKEAFLASEPGRQVFS